MSGLVLDHPATVATRAKRADIASGRRHGVVDLSYAEGWSECSCGFRALADESIRYLDGRHDDLARRMNQHIVDGNGRRSD